MKTTVNIFIALLAAIWTAGTAGSGMAQKAGTLVMDTAYVAGISRTDLGITVKWQSAGQHPPDSAAVYRMVNQEPVASAGDLSLFRIGDTTWYLYKTGGDTAAFRGEQVFFLATFDTLGNPGPYSEPAVAEPLSFDRVSFMQAGADRASGGLGIDLAWGLSTATGVKTIEIWRSRSFDRDFKLVARVGGAETSYFDPAVVPDQVTYYRLAAKGRYGFQYVQSTVFFDVGLDPRNPPPPVILRGYPLDNGTGLVVKGNAPYLAGVILYRRPMTDTAWSQISTVVPLIGDSAVFCDSSTALAGNRYYEYAATAVSTSHLISLLSDPVRVRPGTPVYPEPPHKFEAYAEDGVVKLFWEDMSVAEPTVRIYMLYRAEPTPEKPAPEPEAGDIPLKTLEGANFHVDSSAVPGKRYIYYLKSADIFGHLSREAATASAEVPDNLPIPPAGLVAVKTSAGVVLEWGPAVMDNLAYYKIYRYRRGMTPEMIKLTGKSTTTWTDNTGVPGELYFYYITTLDAKDRESTPSAEAGSLF